MKSILIADEPGGSFGLPWKGDAPCFNFNFPSENVPADELDKIADKSEITTLVIGVDMPDYGFVSEFPNLSQLYIYTGKNLMDLSFIKPLVKLNQLYITESHISSLEPFEELVKEKGRLLAESEDERSFFTYAFEAVCIRSDCLNINPREFKEKYEETRVLLTREFYINNR